MTTQQTSNEITVIRNHIKDGEKPVSHPYLDNKGLVTVGAGKQVETEDEFLGLPLKVKDLPISGDSRYGGVSV